MNQPITIDAIRARLTALEHVALPEMPTNNHEWEIFIGHAPADICALLDAYDAAQQRIGALEDALQEIKALEWYEYGDSMRIAHEIARDVLGASADGAEE